MDDRQGMAIPSSRWEEQQHRTVVAEGRFCLRPRSSACLPSPVMFFNTDLLVTNSTLWEWSAGEEGSQTAPRTGWNWVRQGEQPSGGSVSRRCLTWASSCYPHLDTSADVVGIWVFFLRVFFGCWFFLVLFCFVSFVLVFLTKPTVSFCFKEKCCKLKIRFFHLGYNKTVSQMDGLEWVCVFPN